MATYPMKDYDRVIEGRECYPFDTGMAVALMILMATELGLVVHPIAGYEPEKVRNALGNHSWKAFRESCCQSFKQAEVGRIE